MAFDAGDTRRGSAILHGIFTEDITYLPAWELLHAALNRSEPFEEFQLDFVRRYYPAKLDRFRSGDGDGPERTSTGSPYRRVSLKSSGLRGGERKTATDSDRPEESPRTQEAGFPGDEKQAEKQGLFARLRGFFSRLATRRRSKRKRTDSAAEAVSGTGLDADAKFAPISLKDLPARESSAQPSARERKQRRVDSGPMLTKLHEEHFEIRVVIADDIQQTRENIQKLLKFEPSVEVVGIAAHGEQAIELALEHAPDIVLMDINMPGMDGLQALKTIRERLPLTQVIMLTVQDDPGYLREALQFGARDYLIKPPTIDELLNTIHKTYEIGKQERERLTRMFTPPSETTVEEAVDANGFAIAVYSPKGGVGCTFLATNLAVAAQADDRSVALVDCDLQYGGIGLFFNEQARNSIVDLAPRVKDLDPNIWRDAVVTHQGSGVRLILAPNRPELAEAVHGEQLVELVRVLRKRFQIVIFDTGSSLDGRTAELMAECDQVVVVLTQDIPAIHEVRQLLDFAPKFGLAEGKISLVLNQYHRRINITPEQISRSLRRDLAAVVPMDNRTAIPSVNRGIPFMLGAENRALPIGRAVQALADRVIDRQMVAV